MPPVNLSDECLQERRRGERRPVCCWWNVLCDVEAGRAVGRRFPNDLLVTATIWTLFLVVFTCVIVVS